MTWRRLLAVAMFMLILVCVVSLAQPAHASGKWMGWHRWCQLHPHSHRAVCR